MTFHAGIQRILGSSSAFIVLLHFSYSICLPEEIDIQFHHIILQKVSRAYLTS